MDDKTGEDHIVDFFKTYTEIPDYEILNIVAGGRFPFEVNLSKLYADNETRCKYDKDKFPGAALRLDDTKAHLLVFSSGKFVIMGVSTETQLRRYLMACTSIVQKCDVDAS